MTDITVLGLGAMGSRLAINYANAGHNVTVWNRTPSTADALADQHRLTVAATPRAATNGANIVVSMLTDDTATEAVWLDPQTGALAGLGPDSIAIDSSTITPAMASTLGTAARDAGRFFLEAPVVGSRPQAEAGALLYLIGGDTEVLERAKPLIEVNAGAIRHVGEVGAAATMKLAINGLFGIQVAAYAEILALIERSGLDTATASDILRNLPITSPGLQRIVGLFETQDFAPNFPIDLVAKDFGYLHQLATELGGPHPVTTATTKLYNNAAGGPARDLDIAGIATQYK